MKKAGLELLSPARNASVAFEAILHGADAVYIGPPSHGARKAASNTLEDIERVVDFAHQYRAKVYATVNTIVYDSELKEVENLCRDLYHIGVDALIVQDMALLRLNIPPIALHASTQCDIRTPEKAKFLEEVGFSQLVLARELSLEEIKNISEAVTVPVETFVHGALCVSYSGRCHASASITGRSANRGECAQICRYPFTLKDSEGKIIAKDKYLLSLKDFNASHRLEDLIEAGVRSFKIEGRLKDQTYVKNITALYNNSLNRIIKENKGRYCRTSYGESLIKFEPKADKSFNRGFTDYFLKVRKPPAITSMLSPKSQGEKINSIKELNNGDGISFYDKDGKFTGVNINRIEGNRIIPARKVNLPEMGKIYRTSDVKWEKELSGNTAQRKLALDISFEESGITAKDERGVAVKIPLSLSYEEARSLIDYKSVFEKLGNTPYKLNDFLSSLPSNRFYRISELTALRRSLIELLDKANRAVYPFEYRRKENKTWSYPQKKLDYRDNVSNELSKKFYQDHGVTEIEPAIEITGKKDSGATIMTTRHCILRELGLCLKEKKKPERFRPLYVLEYNGGKFQLEFDCNVCEMKVKL